MTGVAHSLSETPLLREVLRHAEALLREAGVDTPELDARLLMGAALGMTREHMLIHATATAQSGAGYPRAGLHRAPGGARAGFPHPGPAGVLEPRFPPVAGDARPPSGQRNPDR